ncbi:hypothetical protein F5Y12DRAFT_436588 [Xylaria sp. FL1777]|nr:hypothetical protein F5Y12DRAFT_436588 [Xylaria sp. FL1777]
MDDFALPTALPGLTEREAIADVMYRAVLSFDHGDEELLRSAVTDDVIFDLVGSTPKNGFAALKAAVFDHMAHKVDTTHHVSNVRVSLESGASTAQVSCTSFAQHVRKGKGLEEGPHKYWGGGMYLCDVVKEEVSGLWKIKHWKLKIVWVEGNPDVMKRE